MWDIPEVHRSGLMLAIAIVLVVIVQKIAKYLRKDRIELNELTDAHSWSDLDTLLKTYTCSVCDTLLSGTCGRQCDNCGVCSHDKCIGQAEKDQKCKDVYTINEEHKEHHIWVKDGNILIDFDDPDIICSHCDLDCYENEGSLMQCCWCQRVIHSHCFSDIISNECDFGKFRKFIIPSFCITPVKSMRSRHKFKIKELSHPGWTEWTPVIVMANRKSGNSDGVHILSYFRRILNPCQVLDLAVYTPVVLLKWCSVIPAHVRFYVLVAGGDGTVSWVLSTLNRSKIELPNIPPLGIIPLGTGNDLSRVLGWGKEYSNASSPSIYLEKLMQCTSNDLDRWLVTVRVTKNLAIRKKNVVYCYNYFSIGVDAKVAFDFHQTRQTSLYLPNRFLNKVVVIINFHETTEVYFNLALLFQLLYTFFGTRQAVNSDCNGLQNRLELYLDGVQMSSIPELESIVIINIPSWAAGVKLWKFVDGDDKFKPQEMDDGLLEVVGLYSSFHIAQLQIGLSDPYYIGQASEIKIILHDVLPVQIDGEPWIQQPSEITVSFCNKAKILKVLV